MYVRFGGDDTFVTFMAHLWHGGYAVTHRKESPAKQRRTWFSTDKSKGMGQREGSAVMVHNTLRLTLKCGTLRCGSATFRSESFTSAFSKEIQSTTTQPLSWPIMMIIIITIIRTEISRRESEDGVNKKEYNTCVRKREREEWWIINRHCCVASCGLS